MKLKKLKEYLNNLGSEFDNCEVILQKDGEGNGYSPLSVVDENAVYVAETTWCGTVYDKSWSAVDSGMEEDEWKKLLAKKPCIVLAPVN